MKETFERFDMTEKKENGLKEDTDESIDDKGWSLLGSLITGSNLDNNSPF